MSKQRKRKIDWPPHGERIPTFVGLSTEDPLDNGSGLAEPKDNGYARVEVTDWSAAVSSSFHNECDITFPKTTGKGWGEVTHFAIFLKPRGGHIFAHGKLARPMFVDPEDTAKFVPGDLEVSL